MLALFAIDVSLHLLYAKFSLKKMHVTLCTQDLKKKNLERCRDCSDVTVLLLLLYISYVWT